MLKIAVVTGYFPTSVSPWAGHSAYQTLRLLATLCDVHVFCSGESYARALTPKGKGNPLDPHWQPPGVNVTYAPYTAVPVLSRPLNGMAVVRQLLPLVRNFKPDLVFNYVVYPHGFAAVRIARELEVPSVLTAIGSDLNRIPDPLCGWLTRRALRRADLVTTVSQDLRRTAQRMGASPGRTQATLNGCDTSVFYPRDRQAARLELGLDPDAQIIVYVGRLDLRKGLMELIAAMAELRNSHPRAHCYLLGDGHVKPLLIEEIARRQLQQAVTLIPSCVTARVAMWMAAADLVTLPSYNEGCPNVVLEALSSGRPVVATRVGGIPELMNDRAGRLVPAKNAPALARGLREVLDRSWDAETIARAHSRSWMQVALELRTTFEKVLGRS